MLPRLLGTLVLLVLVIRPADASADARVFVTNEKSDDVTVIDATTRTVIKTIAVGKRPRGVAVSPDGRRVFVANSNSDSVSVLDATSLSIVQKIAVGTEPETAVLSPDGRWVVVSNETSNDVHVIETATNT